MMNRVGKLLTIKDMMERTRLSRSTVYRLHASGELRGINLLGAESDSGLVWEEEAVEEWLAIRKASSLPVRKSAVAEVVNRKRRYMPLRSVAGGRE